MAIDLRDLEVFLAVEQHGSFGRAGRQLLISQPAVSGRIRNLERTVGHPVFVRSTTGVTLTPAGEALVPYARRCVALAAEGEVAARAADGVPPFGIAVHSTFASRVVPLVIEGLDAHPRRLAVRDVHSEDVAPLVLDRAVDLGFSIHGPAVPGTRRVRLVADRVVGVCAPDHRLATTSRPSVASLVGGPIALNAWGSGADAFLERTRRAGVRDDQVRACGDVTTALTLALRHGHVAFVAGSAAEVFVGAGMLVPVRIASLATWAVDLDLVHRRRGTDDDAVRAVVAHVRRRIGRR